MLKKTAFTLIELLVVIAVIAILIGMLLPALGRSRDHARRVVSLQNLRSNGTYAAGYAVSNKDSFVNPFPTQPIFGDVNLMAWVWVPNQEGSWGWRYTSSGSESYGYHWIAHTLFTDNDASSRNKSNVAPADLALQRWLRENTGQDAQTDLTWIFPSSYWYPPVFWQNSQRFENETRPDGKADNRFFMRRNTIAECTFPNRKVLLHEAKDFLQKTQPMWNNYAAKPQVLLVDGSGRTMNMAEVYADTSLTPVTPPDKIPQPSGLWAPGESEMARQMYFGRVQGFEWDYTGPAFFWATRNGIRGRDFK